MSSSLLEGCVYYVFSVLTA